MAKKKPSFVRTTISISAELKGRMDKVKDDVNWSSIAAKAFENKLGEIAQAKEKKDMIDVIARLRRSRFRSMDARYKEGKASGEQWARQSAEYEDLFRLDNLWRKLEREPEHDWVAFFAPDQGTPAEIAEKLAQEITPEYGFCGVWDDGITDEQEHLLSTSHEFIRGFAEGALDVWWSAMENLDSN